jgi:hypothetical protein
MAPRPQSGGPIGQCALTRIHIGAILVFKTIPDVRREREIAAMLRSRKLFLASFLAIVAAGAATAPVAAAEETPHFIMGGKEITKELEVDGTINSFFIRVPTVNVEIVCTGIDNKASIGFAWKSKLKIEFTKCTTEAPPNCTVNEPIVIELLDQLVYKAGKKGEEIYDVFYGAEKKSFTRKLFEIEFLGINCAQAGVVVAVGSAIALPTPKKPGEEAESLKLKFMGAASLKGNYVNRESEKEEKAGELTFAGSPASIEGEIKLELEGKAKFGAE